MRRTPLVLCTATPLCHNSSAIDYTCEVIEQTKRTRKGKSVVPFKWAIHFTSLVRSFLSKSLSSRLAKVWATRKKSCHQIMSAHMKLLHEEQWREKHGQPRRGCSRHSLLSFLIFPSCSCFVEDIVQFGADSLGIRHLRWKGSTSIDIDFRHTNRRWQLEQSRRRTSVSDSFSLAIDDKLSSWFAVFVRLGNKSFRSGIEESFAFRSSEVSISNVIKH